MEVRILVVILDEENTPAQDIVGVDDFDLRFQKPNDVTTQLIYADYTGRIVNVEDDDILKLDRSFQQVGDDLGALQRTENTGRTQVQKGITALMLQNLLVILKLNIVLMMKKN